MANNPYKPDDRTNGRLAWAEGFEAGVALAKLEASVDFYHCSGGCCPPDYTIDWSEVDYALDKIKEEA